MSWSNEYIGIPYEINGREMDALDCWGLVRQVYRRELGIKLPSYAGYESSTDAESFAEAFGQEVSAWTKVAEPCEFDVAWCRVMGIECHCGIVLGNGRMLHAMDGNDSCIVDLSSPAWKRRLLSCYRMQ
jgi:cell wall-associated NlpC family hydrolase